MTPYVLKLDMIQTLALASLVLFAGYGIRRRVAFLDRYNIPAPVVGGFVFAAVALVLRLQGVLAFEFDTTLQPPLMVAFFTTIGLGASLSLLKVGGPQVLLFWGLASSLAILQDVVGVSLTTLLGVHPFLGLIACSITMTGGHGTGAAFGKLMEETYQFQGAVTLAMAAATFGLVSGGLIGGPVATALIRGRKLTSGGASSGAAGDARATGLDSEIDTEMSGEAASACPRRMVEVRRRLVGAHAVRRRGRTDPNSASAAGLEGLGDGHRRRGVRRRCAREFSPEEKPAGGVTRADYLSDGGDDTSFCSASHSSERFCHASHIGPL